MIRDKLSMVAEAARISASIGWERLAPTARLASAGDVPSSAESITPTWLTQVLCRHASKSRGY
ncbi:MAG: hypothetical protein QOH91_577 [Mycobacterium sp.]|jgi:hypothetical protein|nr:hypothetical protein [Mycobacterium sp.]